ncbi:MAG: hypothetical protein CMK59_07250 [Proteobacteria bacterium]|nr:hypothetical protein [Pseudomonadota bacterium]
MSNKKEHWLQAVKKIECWFTEMNMNELEHRINNCCEDEDELQEWFVELDGQDISLTLVGYFPEIMLQVRSVVDRVSNHKKPDQLYEQLLRLNATDLSGCAYALEEEDIVVVADQRMHNKGTSEIKHLINMVAGAILIYEQSLNSKT